MTDRDPRTAREDGRALDELRPVSFERDFTVFAPGSVLVSMGRTKVLCTASLEDRVPPWMRGSGQGLGDGRVLDAAGVDRRAGVDREAAKGKQSGRTQEIQRLIGRSLRAVCDLVALGRAADHRRLRRPAGRRRDADGVDLRGLRGAARRLSPG